MRSATRSAMALLGVALSLATVAESTAAPYVDQNNSMLPTGNFVAIRSGTTAAQTFTVGFDGTLAEVRVIVDPRGTPVANLTLEVQGTIAGVPDGVALATASVAPFGGPNPTVVFDVSAAGLAVTAGQVLAFVLKSTAALGNDYLARAMTGNKYGNGQFTDSSGSFANGAGWDAVFKTVVEPAELPGAGALDQANLPAPSGNFAAILTGLTAAQTFTVGNDGILTRIDVMVDPRNSPVLDLYLEVQETTAGAPNGTVVAACSVAPFGGTNPMVTFDLGPYNLAVSDGEVLAFVLRSNAAGGTDYLARARNGDLYAGGEFTNSSGGFATGAGWDAIFETFVELTAPLAAGPVPGGTALVLSQNVPNPVTNGAAIHFALARASHVKLSVYDATGRLVRELVDQELPEGAHEARWDRRSDQGERVSAGVYFYEMAAEGARRAMKMVVAQ